MPFSRRILTVCRAVLVCCTLCGVVSSTSALAAAAKAEHKGKTPEPREHGPAPALTKKLFDVFNQPAVPTPKWVRARLQSPRAHPIYSQAREIPDPRSGHSSPWYLIATVGGDELIAAFPQGTIGVWTASMPVTCWGLFFLQDVVGPGPATSRGGTIYGVVPDDITRVVASGGTGPGAAPVSADVKNNVWAIDVPAGASTLTYYRGAARYRSVHTVAHNSPPKACDSKAGTPPAQ